MRKQEFGFYCGVFSLALSRNGIVIPGSKNKPICRSMFPYMEMNDTAGHYVLHATCGQSVICETLVHVLWVSHHSEAEPFLGFQPREMSPEEFRSSVGNFLGKAVEISLTPFTTEADIGGTHRAAYRMPKKHTVEIRKAESQKETANISAATPACCESSDHVVREYIDFVNRQVGVYMDALAGFAGHYARVERQVCRVLRKNRAKRSGDQPVVWASYEDPSKPDVIHNRIVRADDYLSANSLDGSNTQQHSQAILVFLFTYWEHEIRPRLAKSMGVSKIKNAIRSNIMGDLHILRNAIVHSKGVIPEDKHRRLSLLGDMFSVGQPIHVSYENMHKIFVLIKQDCARFFLKPLGIEDSPNIQPEDFVDVALQMPREPQ